MNKNAEIVGEFTPAHLDKLREEYGRHHRIDPDSPYYRGLLAMLDAMPELHLRQLAEDNIRFVSLLARNRLRSAGVIAFSTVGGSLPGAKYPGPYWARSVTELARRFGARLVNSSPGWGLLASEDRMVEVHWQVKSHY